MAMCDDDDEVSEYTSGFDVEVLCHCRRAGANGVEWVCWSSLGMQPIR